MSSNRAHALKTSHVSEGDPPLDRRKKANAYDSASKDPRPQPRTAESALAQCASLHHHPMADDAPHPSPHTSPKHRIPSTKAICSLLSVGRRHFNPHPFLNPVTSLSALQIFSCLQKALDVDHLHPFHSPWVDEASCCPLSTLVLLLNTEMSEGGLSPPPLLAAGLSPKTKKVATPRYVVVLHHHQFLSGQVEKVG